MDQRSELMNNKKMRRYVKDGSGRCHVLRVSGNLMLIFKPYSYKVQDGKNSIAYVSVSNLLADALLYRFPIAEP